jgi:threonylcarbamoyladenosine tRNA methylthiotransferase MtaB
MGMGRNYRRADVLSAVDSLRRVKGSFSGSLWRGPFIAADLIAGFPGETEDDAAATMELARDCDFAWIHVFRFSPRPGTRASSMPNRVPERLVRERVEALLDLAKVCRTAYIDRWIEAELSAILEVGLGATSSNYLKLKIRGLPEEARPGQTVICRINEGRCISSEEDVDAFALYIQPEY